MSVVEKLEEALAKFPMSEYPNIYTNYLKDVIKPAFVAFKKDYDSQIHVSRKKLEELMDRRKLWDYVEVIPKKRRICLTSMNYAIRYFIEKELLGVKNNG